MAKRIALFDNIKGVLIILVVAGHFMHPVHNDNLALSAAFDVIYLFHMPLFVFVSGLFAKGAYREGHLNVNRMISFLVLGLAYQAAYLAISGMLTPQRMLLFTSAPWYLIGMVWWYAATPMLSRLPAPAGLAVSLCASLASGCIDLSNGFLAISRSLAFLPFFSLGYYCTTEQLEHLSYRRGLWAAVVAAVCIALLRIADAHAYDWFFQMVYGDNPYRSSIASGMAARLTATAIAVLFSLATLKLVPKASSKLTVLGARTLQVYVLHRLIRAWLTFQTPFYHLPILLDPLIGSAIILALSGGITALCSIPALTPPFDALMRMRWIPKRSAEGHTA